MNTKLHTTEQIHKYNISRLIGKVDNAKLINKVEEWYNRGHLTEQSYDDLMKKFKPVEIENLQTIEEPEQAPQK